MFKKSKKPVSTVAIALLLASGLTAPAIADSTSVDVSNAHVSAQHLRHKVSSNDPAPVNENRDAGDAPVVQPVASMKGQTCIAAGGVEVPCETDDSWFYAPESCYASTPSMAPYARKRNYTTFECKPVGKDVPLPPKHRPAGTQSPPA